MRKENLRKENTGEILHKCWSEPSWKLKRIHIQNEKYYIMSSPKRHYFIIACLCHSLCAQYGLNHCILLFHAPCPSLLCLCSVCLSVSLYLSHSLSTCKPISFLFLTVLSLSSFSFKESFLRYLVTSWDNLSINCTKTDVCWMCLVWTPEPLHCVWTFPGKQSCVVHWLVESFINVLIPSENNWEISRSRRVYVET